MANKFEVNGQILTITDTVTNKTLVKSPKADLFYYIEALEATIPSIKLYDISGANSSGGATTFNCLLSTAVDSTNTAFTVETFKTFADSNLGFKSASLETDPVFGSSEASLFVSGDKAKLDNTWLKGGNTGTNPATDFIGTTDAQDLAFRTNNVERARILSNGNFGINTIGSSAPLEVRSPIVGSNVIGTTLIQRIRRTNTNGVKFNNTLDILVGTYTTSSASNTRVDFNLSDGATSNPDINVMTLHGNGRVGFGTDTPLGYIDARPIIFSANQNGGYRLATKTGEWASGMFLKSDVAGNARLSFDAVTGVDVLNLFSNGRVAIGTTSPTKTLDINGELRIRTLPTGLSTENILVVNGSGDVRSIAPTTLQSGTAGQVAFFNGANVQGGSNNLFWDNTNGRLGIGTNTPTDKLHISGSSGTTKIKLEETSVNGLSQIELTNNERSLLISNNAADDLASIFYAGTNRLQFNLTNQWFLSGNVGIGTNTPSYALDVRNGSVYAHNGSFLLSGFNSVAGSQYFGKSYLSGIIAGMEIENTTLGGNYSQRLHFRTHQFAASEGIRMTIAENGNVGIGTTAPTSRLQVTGLPSYADNATAIANGLTVGAFYHTSGTLKVVI